jgi:hypothetical protein
MRRRFLSLVLVSSASLPYLGPNIGTLLIIVIALSYPIFIVLAAVGSQGG